MTQKIIIDADPGIGDAVAIALALWDPELNVLAITATAGAVPGSLATRNLQAIVESLDPPKWPRLGRSSAGAESSPIDFRATAITSEALNGKDGLGEWNRAVAEMHHLHDSAKVLIDLTRQYPHEISLLTLGPLTNIDLACELDAGFLGRLKGLFCLGGAVECGGDVTATAELNIFANPEAARNVLRSPATKTLIPLDVSRQPVLTFDTYNRLLTAPHTSLARFLAELLPFSLRAHRQFLGVEGVPLSEVTALCALRGPELFTAKAMAVDVETSGELTRGMTVFDRRGIPQWQTNIDVVIEVDAQGVIDYFASLLDCRL